MKKELLWAACISALLGTGVLMLAGGSEPEGLPWKPLNEKLETALALQEGTLEPDDDTQPAKEAAKKSEERLSTQKMKTEAETAGKEKSPAHEAKAKGEAVDQPSTQMQSAEPASVQSGQAQPLAPPVQAPASTQAADANEASKPIPVTEDGKIHLNSADASQLMELPGVGEKKAQAILDYRAKNGPFHDVTDVVNVKGIGPKMLEKMLPDLAL